MEEKRISATSATATATATSATAAPRSRSRSRPRTYATTAATATISSQNTFMYEDPTFHPSLSATSASSSTSQQSLESNKSKPLAFIHAPTTTRTPNTTTNTTTTTNTGTGIPTGTTRRPLDKGVVESSASQESSYFRPVTPNTPRELPPPRRRQVEPPRTSSSQQRQQPPSTPGTGTVLRQFSQQRKQQQQQQQQPHSSLPQRTHNSADAGNASSASLSSSSSNSEGSLPRTSRQIRPVTPTSSSSIATPPIHERLCWRMDPSQSMSDWRLEIFNRSTKQFHTYFVHRVVLAVGPRGCRFFQNAFQQQTNATSNNTVTRIPLIAQACRWMPDFLDFVYGKTEQFYIQTENAMGLAHLADYFQQETLSALVDDFLQDDLRCDTLHCYWVDAVYYDDHDFLDCIIEVGARELPQLEASSKGVSAFLFDLTPEYLLPMLEQVAVEEAQHNPNLSHLVVEYCALHRHDMTVDVLQQLTTPLVCLTPLASIAFLELELALQEDDKAPLSSLQERCLQVLAHDWETMGDMDPQTLQRLLQNGSTSGYLLEWFPQTLQRANQQLRRARDDLEAALQSQTELVQELELVEQERQKSQHQALTLRKTLDTAKTEMKEQVQGWIRKHDQVQLERKAEGESWEQERHFYITERQAWIEERAELERKLIFAKKETDRARRGKKACPRVDPRDCSYDVSEDSTWFSR